MTIDITESALISCEGEGVPLLDALPVQGVGIALDVDKLRFKKSKIDQTFVKRFLDGPGAAASVRSVLQLASKPRKTVAEGLETATQAGMFQKFGFHTGQGYYFTRPMAVVDVHKTFGATSSN